MNTILDRLSSAQGIAGDGPNISLAEELSTWTDEEALARTVTVLVAGLDAPTRRQQSDCIKVLYELGERRPTAIATHVDRYAALLRSRNNRLVWGGMAALAASALAEPQAVSAHLQAIEQTMAQGTVITIDKAMLTLSRLAASSPARGEELLPDLLARLATIRAQSLPMYAEFISPATTGPWARELEELLLARLPELSKAQAQRVQRLLRRLAAA